MCLGVGEGVVYLTIPSVRDSDWFLWKLTPFIPSIDCNHAETLPCTVLPDFTLKKSVWPFLSSACSLLIQFKTFTENQSPSKENKENYNNGKKDSHYRHIICICTMLPCPPWLPLNILQTDNNAITGKIACVSAPQTVYQLINMAKRILWRVRLSHRLSSQHSYPPFSRDMFTRTQVVFSLNWIVAIILTV